MKLVVVLFMFVTPHVIADGCKPKYHYWRPYNGTIPNDAFIAGVDRNGETSYVAKVLTPDEFQWTIPVQIREGWDIVDFAWCCTDGNVDPRYIRIDKFIEILCVDDPANLSWKKVNKSITEIQSKCCFIEGGMAIWEKHLFVAYVGRGSRNGQYYVGRVYLESGWNGVHMMDGTRSSKIVENFSVLSYDCKK